MRFNSSIQRDGFGVLAIMPGMVGIGQGSLYGRLKRPFLRVLDVFGANALTSAALSRSCFLVGYHSITAPETDGFLQASNYPAQVKLPLARFIEQLDWLSAHGHTFIRFEDIPIALERGVKKPTVIYFDDGYKDTLENALPILMQRKIPATVFLVTDLLDGTKRSLRGFLEKEGFTPFLDWEGAQELVRRGVTIGSHGISHKKFTNCTEEELERELRDSKRLLEERLNIKVDLLSYPHGRANDHIARAAALTGYRLGVTTRPGINTQTSILRRPLLLRKVDPRGDDSLADFRAKLYTGSVIGQLRGK